MEPANLLLTLLFGLVTLGLIALCFFVPTADFRGVPARAKSRRAVGRAAVRGDRRNARERAIGAALGALVRGGAVCSFSTPKGLVSDGEFSLEGGGEGRYRIVRELQAGTSYVVELETSGGEDGEEETPPQAA